MSTSSCSDSEVEVVLPHDLHRQKRHPLRRQQRSIPASLTLLVIAILININAACQSPIVVVYEEKKTEATESGNSDDLYIHHTTSDLSSETELSSGDDVSTPVFLSVSESTSALNPLTLDVPAITSAPLIPASHRPADIPKSTQPYFAVATRLPAIETPTALPVVYVVASEPTATVTPIAAIETFKINHVIIISIDGLRPDALLTAEAPNLDKLIAKGSFCPQAQTVSLSITLPGHASMLSGMLPEKHGILWGLPYIGWPGMAGPTIFTVAHEAGLSTGMVFGKEKMNYMVLSPVDQFFGQDAHDPEIKEQAIKFIREGLPHILFIHFPDTDRVGHAYGWLSPNQFQSIAFVDGLIGEVVAELDREGYLNQTLLIISSDHGGHGFSHGDDAPEDRTIPWLAVGPGVPAGVTLTRPINTYDTAATVLYALGLPIPEKWDGQPVMEIFPPQ
jgi:hypothetical protein